MARQREGMFLAITATTDLWVVEMDGRLDDGTSGHGRVGGHD
jgi:hypothetical protein